MRAQVGSLDALTIASAEAAFAPLDSATA